MALVNADRVKETTVTTGTGTLTLGGAVTGFQSFSAIGDGNTAYCCCYAVDANGIATGQWEVFLGTYTASGTTLARTTLIASSTGSAVNFSAGTKHVIVCYPSQGTIVARQPGGVAATDEVQIYHDGTDGYLVPKSGMLRIPASAGNVPALRLQASTTTPTEAVFELRRSDSTKAITISVDGIFLWNTAGTAIVARMSDGGVPGWGLLTAANGLSMGDGSRGWTPASGIDFVAGDRLRWAVSAFGAADSGLGRSSAGETESNTGTSGVIAAHRSFRKANAQTGTTYTLVLTDGGRFVSLSNASAITLTVPPNADVAFPTGTEIDIAQLGAGTVTIAAGSGVTIRSRGSLLSLNGQYSGAKLKKLDTNEWLLTGDLA